jgi:hypothetical protein
MQGKAIVIDDHTLGVIMGEYVQILRSSVLRGSHYPDQGYLCLPDQSRYRAATLRDFDTYKVHIHSDYF